MKDYKNCINYSATLCFYDSVQTHTPCFCRCDGNTNYKCPNFKKKSS